MTNSTQNIQTPNQIEGNMNSNDQLIQALHNHFADNPMGFTEYRKQIESILRDQIKPISSRSSMSVDGNDWRSDLKSRFGGRGAKWVFIPLNEIESTLQEFENNNIDCSSYRKFTQASNKAWIRFSGGRVNNEIQSAAFEVRTEGSKIDHPKQLHYIAVEKLDGLIETMPGTPHSLKLEEDSKPMPNKDSNEKKTKTKPENKKPKQKTKKKSQVEMIADDLNEELSLPTPPESSDPADWEAFLSDEGLDADFGDEDIFESL